MRDEGRKEPNNNQQMSVFALANVYTHIGLSTGEFRSGTRAAF